MKFLPTLFACLIAGTALSGAALAQSGKPLDKVSVRYGFIATGNDSAWAYGVEKGFFKQEGIDVDLRQGKGSAVTAQTVGAGSDDFGIDIDGGTFLSLAAKGLPATAVMATAAASPVVVLSPQKSPIAKPADLVGKKIAITAGDGPSALLKVLMDRNKVPADKVTMVNMQPGPKLSSLLTGRVDGVATNVVVKATLEAKGLPIHVMNYSDYGVSTPGQYLIVNNDYMKSHPDVVRRLIKALQKSMAATLANPAAAAEAFHKMYPNYDEKTALGETKLITALYRSKNTKGRPLGTVSLKDAKEGAEVLAAAGMMPAATDVSKFVTDKFVGK